MKWLASAFGLALLLSASAAAQGAGQNILLLILDDVGTELVGVYGEGRAPAPTPNIDSLAEGGVLFRNAYSSPVCSPTRATILTGRYGFRNGVGQIGPNNRLMRRDLPTLPELLPAAYTTRRAVIGKWHLGGTHINLDARHPVDFAGFDFYEGQPGNFRRDEGHNYYNWYKITAEAGPEGTYLEEDVTCRWQRGGGRHDTSCYITSVTVDDVIERIDAYGNEPWFLWVGFNAIHEPIDVEPPRRLLRHRYDYTKASQQRKAHLEALDREIGRLLKAIRHTDTTIIVVSDNGTQNGCKRTVQECGIRVPLIIKRAGARGGHHESDALVNTTDLFETIIELATGEAVSGEADSPDSESLVPYLDDPTLPTAHRASVDGPYVYAEKFEPTDAIDEKRALRGDRAALASRGGANDWDQSYKLVYQRVGDDPNEYRLEKQLFALGNAPVPQESGNLLYDGDNDTVPDVPLSPGAQNALEDLLATMDRLQDCDETDESGACRGDGVPYRLDNCIEVVQARTEQVDEFCDTDQDGIGNLCDCDLDNDGFCDEWDAEVFADNRGLTGPNVADLDCDEVVGDADFDRLAEMLGSGPGPSGVWCTDATRDPWADPPCTRPGS